MQPLFEDQTADATSIVYSVAGISERSAYPGLAGETVTVLASGTFGDGTVTLQASPTASGPWVALPDGVFSAATVQVMPLSRRAFVRAVLASADTNTDISLWIG